MNRQHKKFVSLGLSTVTLISAALIAAPAFATPPVGGFSPVLVFHGVFGPLDLKAEKNDKWDLLLRSKGQTDLRVTTVSFAAHSSSGWHSHPGPNLLTVTAGEVVVYEGDSPLCTGTIIHTNGTFTDTGGSHIHLVRNETGVPAVIMATALYPNGVVPLTDTRPSKPANCPANIL